MEHLFRFEAPNPSPPPEWSAPYLVFRADRLPPLPPVVDRTTFEHALTHKSALSRAELADLDPLTRERNENRSNRLFEWEGDALFTWPVTKELVERFPLATAGDLSVSARSGLQPPQKVREEDAGSLLTGLCFAREQTLRQKVMSNRTLSHLVWSYSFGSALRVAHDTSQARPRGLQHQKIFADAFEAYLAAAACPRTDESRLGVVRLYVHALLSSDCAEGFAEAALDLRKCRLAGAPHPAIPDHAVSPIRASHTRKS